MNSALTKLIVGIIVLLTLAAIPHSATLYLDQSIYHTVAHQIASGKKLYQEVWVSKPPLIYYLNYIFIWFPSSIPILVFGVIGIMAVLLSMKSTLNSKELPVLGIGLFVVLFYHDIFWEGGGFTEEYSSHFVAIMIAIICVPTENRHIQCLIAGLFAGLAITTKETALLLIAPWVTVVLVRNGVAKAFSYILGLILPILIYLTQFALDGSLLDYFKYLVYSEEYTRHLGMSLSNKIWNGFVGYWSKISSISFVLSILPIIGLFISFRSKNLIYMAFSSMFILSIIGASLSGYQFGHYYTPIVFPTVVLVLIGVEGICELIKSFVVTRLVQFTLIILAAVTSYTKVSLFFEADNQIEIKSLSEDIQTKIPKGSTVYIDNTDLAWLYSLNEYQTNAYIPVPVFHFYMIKDRFCVDRIEKQKQSLLQTPPDYLVMNVSNPLIMKYPELNGLVEHSFNPLDTFYFESNKYVILKQ